MIANAVVRARVNDSLKREASIILEAMGLTLSDAFRLMLARVVQEKALPFEPLIPNEKTIQAMRDARRGKVTCVEDIDNLLSSLNEND